MQIRVISVGKVKQRFVLDGEGEFLPRLKGDTKVELIEVEAAADLPEAQAKVKEGEAVLSKVRSSDLLIVLDEKGKPLSSPEFAKFMQNEMTRGRSSFVFAIGGYHGWDPAVLKRAHRVMSLSSLTFTYQMTRLILVEQIYRAMTIIKGVPYHR
jgi:23S rRNA (pseudouridine1915-N3)-methyltransferase